MFREALGYPTRRPEGGRSVIVGGLLLVAVAVFVGIAGLDAPYSYLVVLGVVPWLLVRGYYVRVVRTTIGRDRPTPPRFGNIRRLFADGVRAVGISVAYLLPGVVVLAPLVAAQVLGTDLSTLLSDGGAGAATGAIVTIIGVVAVVALMYVIGALYALPVAVARFAHADDVRAAFEVRTVASGAFTEDYVIAWAISFAIQLFLIPVSYLLRILLVGFFLQFIVVVAVRYCYGQGVGAALGLDPVPAAHERSDPDDWDLRSAVRRADAGDRPTRRHDDSIPRPAVRRIEDTEPDFLPGPAAGRAENDDSTASIDPPETPGPDRADGPETFGGGFRPAVDPEADDDNSETR